MNEHSLWTLALSPLLILAVPGFPHHLCEDIAKGHAFRSLAFVRPPKPMAVSQLRGSACEDRWALGGLESGWQGSKVDEVVQGPCRNELFGDCVSK